MKNIFLVALIFLAPLSHAGNKTGNGGGGWVCRDNHGHIQWSELVDLYEATYEHGLALKRPFGTYEQMVDEAVKRIKFPYDWDWFGLKEVARYVSKTEYLRESATNVTYVNHPLPIINDSLYSVIPRASLCARGHISFEQIVNFQDDGKIWVQRQLFQSLSEQSRAALVVHEGLYAWARPRIRDSINIRKLIGIVFSNLSDDSVALQFFNFAMRTWPYSITPGHYELSFTAFNRNGNRSPMKAVPFSVLGEIYDPSTGNSLPGTVYGKSDRRGRGAVFLSGQFGDIYWMNSKLRVQFRGTTYEGRVDSSGWAAELKPIGTESGNSWCELTVVQRTEHDRTGKIKIICAEK
jgi:hypothetical protein